VVTISNDSESVSLTYTASAYDAWLGSVRLLRLRPKDIAGRLIFGVVEGLALDVIFPASFAAHVLIVIAAIIFIWALTEVIVYVKTSRSRDFSAPRKLEANADGLAVEMPAANAQYQWSAFDRWYLHSKGLGIHLRSPHVWWWISNDWFSSPDDLERLKALLVQQIPPTQGP
jgi:hypothetical protein